MRKLDASDVGPTGIAISTNTTTSATAASIATIEERRQKEEPQSNPLSQVKTTIR